MISLDLKTGSACLMQVHVLTANMMLVYVCTRMYMCLCVCVYMLPVCII